MPPGSCRKVGWLTRECLQESTRLFFCSVRYLKLFGGVIFFETFLPGWRNWFLGNVFFEIIENKIFRYSLFFDIRLSNFMV